MRGLASIIKLFMQETPRPWQDEEKEAADAPPLSADQKDRPYYYDDGHGYETYCPDLDDEEPDEPPLPGTGGQIQPRQ